MTERNLTLVELLFYPEYLNYWLRFGQPMQRVDLDRRRAIAVFKPGQVLGYLRWRANEYGTQTWEFWIAETREAHRPITRLEGINPGAEILLRLSGVARVRRVLAKVDRLEREGFELKDISPSYYRHLHNRVVTRCNIRPYSKDQHAAHLAARKVRS